MRDNCRRAQESHKWIFARLKPSRILTQVHELFVYFRIRKKEKKETQVGDDIITEHVAQSADPIEWNGGVTWTNRTKSRYVLQRRNCQFSFFVTGSLNIYCRDGTPHFHSSSKSSIILITFGIHFD